MAVYKTKLTGANVTRLHVIVNDPFKLWATRLEIAATVEVAACFHHATYALEGDGPLALTTYDILCLVREDITTWHPTMDYPKLRALIREVLPLAVNGDNTEQFWRTHCHMITLPDITYFETKIFGELMPVVKLFRGMLTIYIQSCSIPYIPNIIQALESSVRLMYGF
jgi:hypothetical protein